MCNPKVGSYFASFFLQLTLWQMWLKHSESTCWRRASLLFSHHGILLGKFFSFKWSLRAKNLNSFACYMMMHLLNKHSLRRILHFTFRRNTCAGTMQYAQLLIQCSCMNGRHASGSADVSEISAQGKESVEILGFFFFFLGGLLKVRKTGKRTSIIQS